jgi:hypothetical protein
MTWLAEQKKRVEKQRTQWKDDTANKIMAEEGRANDAKKRLEMVYTKYLAELVGRPTTAGGPLVVKKCGAVMHLFAGETTRLATLIFGWDKPCDYTPEGRARDDQVRFSSMQFFREWTDGNGRLHDKHEDARFFNPDQLAEFLLNFMEP